MSTQLRLAGLLLIRTAILIGVVGIQGIRRANERVETVYNGIIAQTRSLIEIGDSNP